MDEDGNFIGPDIHLENGAADIDFELEAGQTSSNQPVEYAVFRQLMQGIVLQIVYCYPYYNIIVGIMDLEHLSQPSDATSAPSQDQAGTTSRLERLSRLLTLRFSSGDNPLVQAIQRARQEEAQSADDDDEEEDGSDSYYISRESRRDISELFPPVTEPQKVGKELLNSGEFGKISTKSSEINLARALRKRSTLTHSFTKEDLISVLTIFHSISSN